MKHYMLINQASMGRENANSTKIWLTDKIFVQNICWEHALENLCTKLISGGF